MTLSFIPHNRLENTSESLKNILNNMNKDHANSIDSVDNVIRNNMNSKVNDTLNNTINIKYLFCDSLQEKNLNEPQTITSTKRKIDFNNRINSNKDNVKKVTISKDTL